MSGVFIVGAPRSGTTLLQSIISSHSEFFSLPETSFFTNIIPLLGIRSSDPDFPIDSKGIELIKQDFKLMTGVESNISAETAAGISTKRAFEKLIAGFNKDQKDRWIEKTTNHARCMLAVRRFYPNAKFIHVIRDPVDSIASMASLKPVSISDFRISYISSYYGFARLWKKCVLSALQYPDQKNVLHIFYEDLVLKPRTVLEEVCRFLEVSFEESLMETFHKNAESLFSEQNCPWQKDNLIPGFHTDAVHKWRKKLSIYKIWLIQNYTQDLARYLGYYEHVKANSILLIFLNATFDQIKLAISVTRSEKLIRKLIVRLIK
jgi:hypothetical protein